MKTYSNQEILDKLAELIKDMYSLEITIEKNTEDTVQIQFKNMYEYCPMSFEMLMKLAEFFDTKNINDDDRYHTNGCATCDYGSVYKFTLTIRPEKNNS